MLLHNSYAVRSSDYAVDHRGCWVWQGTTDHNGYGLVYTGTTRKAHRLYYEQLVGPIPDGFHIHHRCENKSCVNPEHLEPLHPAEHLHGHMVELKRILTDEQRAEIRELGRDRMNLLQDVADRYGVSKSYIDYVWKGARFDEGGDGPVVMDPVPCPQCGTIIPPTRRRSARYCTKACRLKFNQRKRYRRNR